LTGWLLRNQSITFADPRPIGAFEPGGYLGALLTA
jgi:hypothetical protein